MSALLLCVAMCVPMYLFEHHLACDLVNYSFVYSLLVYSLLCRQLRKHVFG